MNKMNETNESVKDLIKDIRKAIEELKEIRKESAELWKFMSEQVEEFIKKLEKYKKK